MWLICVLGAICASQCTVAAVQHDAHPSAGSSPAPYEGACRLHLGHKGLAPVFISCRWASMQHAVLAAVTSFLAVLTIWTLLLHMWT